MKPNNMTEWEFFVYRHQKTGNLVFHFFSFVVHIAVLAYVLITQKWLYLVLLSLSGILGTLGHVLFKDGQVRSKDFLHPQTLYYLFMIFIYVLTGKYSHHVAIANQKYSQQVQLS